VEVLLYPVRVQGEGAAVEIAAAIRTLNEQAADLGGIDVMIVGRGGGSLEDLWAFNEEIVARAIYASRIPIISGVGHEVDFTIADHVADMRAPTPTAAAELAVPVLAEVLDAIGNCEARLRRCANHQIEVARSRLESMQRAEMFRNPLAIVRRAEQQTDELAGRLRHATSQTVSQAHRRLNELQVRLADVRPAVLVREQQARLTAAEHRLNSAIQQWCRRTERRVEQAGNALRNASPARRIATETEKVRQDRLHLDRGLAHRLAMLHTSVESLARRLDAMSYRRTLARGFSVTWDEEQRQIITAPDAVQPGQTVITQTAGGDFRSRVEP
jgi:exodeoxyribonuclease VII large subunit